MVLVWVPESIVVTIRDPGSGTQDTRSQITTMLSGTQQSGTQDLVPGTHWVPKSIAIQSGTRDLGTQVPESIVVPFLKKIYVPISWKKCFCVQLHISFHFYHWLDRCHSTRNYTLNKLLILLTASYEDLGFE